jgi:hypothetical protein
MSAQQRGTFGFWVDEFGNLQDRPENVETLRKLWADRSILPAGQYGPGVNSSPGKGAWHVSCHVVSAGCMRKATDGRLLWLELAYKGSPDQYYPSLTTKSEGTIITYDCRSQEAKALLSGSKLLGFVEGNSRGRISAKGISDPSGRFEGWPRQNYDKQASDDSSNGGKVWEHWCTTREIEQTSDLGNSVLSGYVSLCAIAGDIFAPTVARGRTEYNHPDQLNALIKAGFTTAQAASVIKRPLPLTDEKEHLFNESDPTKSFAAAERLDWSDAEIRYYMFRRKISNWDATLRVP